MQKTILARADAISQDVQHLKLPSLYFPEVPGSRMRDPRILVLTHLKKTFPNTFFSLERSSATH